MQPRSMPAGHTGPVAIQAELGPYPADVKVRAYPSSSQPNSPQPSLTIGTADDSGPAADAVRAAQLRWDRRVGVLETRLWETDAADGDRAGADERTPSVIEVSAVVTEDSRVTMISTAASLEITGSLKEVDAETLDGALTVQYAYLANLRTGGGMVSLDEGDQVRAKTGSGDMNLGRIRYLDVETFDGNVAVQHTDDGKIVAKDGSVTVVSGGNLNLRTRDGAVNVGEGDQVTAVSTRGDVDLGQVGSADATASRGNVVIGAAIRSKAMAPLGTVTIGSTGDVEARSLRDCTITSWKGGVADVATDTGRITIHCTGGGLVTARSATGTITITATDAALKAGLTIDAKSGGTVSMPEGAAVLQREPAVTATPEDRLREVTGARVDLNRNRRGQAR